MELGLSQWAYEKRVARRGLCLLLPVLAGVLLTQVLSVGGLLPFVAFLLALDDFVDCQVRGPLSGYAHFLYPSWRWPVCFSLDSLATILILAS